MVRELASAEPCVAVRVPAKLNLFLGVRGRRADGYHEIVTVLQTVSLYDRIRAGLLGPPGQSHHPSARRRMRLRLAHDAGPDLPAAEGNLAVQAARQLGHATRVIDLAVIDERATWEADPDHMARGTPVTILELRKTIPLAGGMAGGSADAAASLVALNELWGCGLSRDELRAVAADIGSDVPFCLVGGTALATGRGNAVVQVLCRGTFHWVVCQSPTPLPTPEVYRSWDRSCEPTEVEPDAVLAALRGEDPEALGAALHNELEPAAFDLRPELQEAKRGLLDAGALGAVLSGSGPTLLALCADEAHAGALADAVRGEFRSVQVVHSPAGGPGVEEC